MFNMERRNFLRMASFPAILALNPVVRKLRAQCCFTPWNTAAFDSNLNAQGIAYGATAWNNASACTAAGTSCTTTKFVPSDAPASWRSSWSNLSFAGANASLDSFLANNYAYLLAY